MGIERVRKLKNLVGWCACDDCRQRATVLVTIEQRKKDGMIKRKNHFFICQDHAAEIANDIQHMYKKYNRN